MHVGVLRLRVGLQIGGFGGPIGILPHDERLVQGVEAVTAQRGGVDGKGFLVAFGVCEVQRQGVGDPAFLLQGPDDLVDEVVGHGFVLVGQDYVHISTAMPPISDTPFQYQSLLARQLRGVNVLPQRVLLLNSSNQAMDQKVKS